MLTNQPRAEKICQFVMECDLTPYTIINLCFSIIITFKKFQLCGNVRFGSSCKSKARKYYVINSFKSNNYVSLTYLTYKLKEDVESHSNYFQISILRLSHSILF